MTECFIYDHVRTPRGRGKPDGALHTVTTLELATQALSAIRDRNGLDSTAVDDAVLGCVDPVGAAGGGPARGGPGGGRGEDVGPGRVAPIGEAGGDIARAAALNAGFDQSVPGIQVSRFCASGLDAANLAGAPALAAEQGPAL